MWLADTTYFEVSFYSSMLFSLVLRCIRAVFPGPGTAHFYVLLVTQLFLSLASPLLGCLAPVLSKLYFPRKRRALATSIGTISGIVGMGVGLTTAPLYKHDIPGLYLLLVAMPILPLILSLFCLDFLVCYTKGASGSDTSYRRLVRQLTSSLGLDREPRQTPLYLPLLSSATALPAFVYADRAMRDQQRQETEPDRHLRDLGDSENGPESSSTNSRYSATLLRILGDFAFIRLMVATGLMTGVVSKTKVRNSCCANCKLCPKVFAWIALVSEAAPPAVDNARGAQLICGLFFGFGTLGTVIFGVILDRWREYISLARLLLLLGSPPSLLAMYGWHTNKATYIYFGMAATGFLCKFRGRWLFLKSYSAHFALVTSIIFETLIRHAFVSALN